MTDTAALDLALALQQAVALARPHERCTERDHDHVAMRITCGYCLANDIAIAEGKARVLNDGYTVENPAKCEAEISGRDYDGALRTFGTCGDLATWCFDVVEHGPDGDEPTQFWTCHEHRIKEGDSLPYMTLVNRTRHDRSLSLNDAADDVHAAGYEAHIEHTGGGVWALYAGAVFQDNTYPVIAGPATQEDDGMVVADVSDLYVGKDDQGESEHYTATIDDDEASIAQRVVDLCKASRYRPVTQAGPGTVFDTRIWDTVSHTYVEGGDGEMHFVTRGLAEAACAALNGTIEVLTPVDPDAEAAWEDHTRRSNI
jgi:hypothetical protein